MAMIYSPQEKAKEIEEKMILMNPEVEKGTYTRTHEHMIYSNRLYIIEQQHLAAVSHHIIHTDERRFIVLESATDLPLNYIRPLVLLNEKETGNTKSISELLHNADDLIVNNNGEPTSSPFTRVQYIDDGVMLLQYRARQEDMIYANFERIHKLLIMAASVEREENDDWTN